MSAFYVIYDEIMSNDLGESPIMSSAAPSTSSPKWPANREVYFIVTPLRIRHDLKRHGIPISIVCRDIKKDGAKSVALRRLMTPEVITTIPNEADRDLLSKIAKNDKLYGYGSIDCSKVLLNPENYDRYLPLLIATQRCFFESVQSRYHLSTVEDASPLRMDDGPAWSLAIQWERQENVLLGKPTITRKREAIRFEDIQAIYPGAEDLSGILIHKDVLSPYVFRPLLYSWFRFFMRRQKLTVPCSEWESYANKLMMG